VQKIVRILTDMFFMDRNTFPI